MDFVGVGSRKKVVDITRKAGTAETLSESVIHCALDEKDVYLYYFIKSHKVNKQAQLRIRSEGDRVRLKN